MSIGKSGLEEEMRNWFQEAERVVIAGIGNPIRMDDFVGVKIVQDLRGKVSDRVLLIECETVPEGYLEQIADFNPSHLLLIDAAILGLRAGDVRLVDPEKLVSYPAFSTHMLPLRMFCEYVAGATKAKIGLLLVEPRRTDFGEGLTPEITAKAGEIAGTLQKLLR